MIEPVTPINVQGYTKLVEMNDFDTRTYYENEELATELGEEFVIVNDLSYTRTLTFRLIPFRSLLNKYVDRVSKGEIELEKENDDDGLEKNEMLNKLNYKINGMKGSLTKEINELKKENGKLKDEVTVLKDEVDILKSEMKYLQEELKKLKK